MNKFDHLRSVECWLAKMKMINHHYIDAYLDSHVRRI